MVGTLVLGLAGAVCLALCLFVVGTGRRPTVTVEHVGEWVTDDGDPAVRATLRIDDLGPLVATVGDGATLTYRLELNGVELASGERSDVALDSGAETITVRTAIHTDELPAWWAAYVAADETIDLVVRGDLVLATPLTPTLSVGPVERRLQSDETPVRDALSVAADELVGTYTVDPTGLIGELTGGLFDPGGPTGPVGYEMQDARVEWGAVTAETTTVVLELAVANPGPVPVPVVPAAVRLTADLDGRPLFATAAHGATLADAAEPPLAPGERRTVSVPVATDTGDAADWFLDHVRAGERSTLTVRLGLAFEVPGLGATLSVPADGVVTVSREIETDMFNPSDG